VERVNYLLFIYRQLFVDMVALSAYASAGTLSGRRGPKRAVRLFSRQGRNFKKLKITPETQSRKGFRIKIGFLGVFASLREKMSWVYRQLFVDILE